MHPLLLSKLKYFKDISGLLNINQCMNNIQCQSSWQILSKLHLTAYPLSVSRDGPMPPQRHSLKVSWKCKRSLNYLFYF